MPKARDAFRTISEVSDWLDAPAHVLRFWESKFSQIKPVKRAGGRRYYRPADMVLLSGIQKLLHEDGMTIKAVQDLLKTKGVRHVSAFGADPTVGEAPQIERPKRAKADGAKPIDKAVEKPAKEAVPPSAPASEAPLQTHSDPEVADPPAVIEPDAPATEEPIDYGPLFAFMNEPADEATPAEPQTPAPAKLEPLGASIPDDPLEADIEATSGLLTTLATTPRASLKANRSAIAPHLSGLREISARLASG
ncbi:MerR family transcriptional regulator [Aestuariibius insulae]|uniref:MerR family transcriptional regulator n=1 Tax=Aestuariibius insulae TaxID=2058287 RepID=UPI00345E1516